MFNEASASLPAADEADALLADLDLFLDRQVEYVAEVNAAPDEFAAYWAGSASASVMRDYRAGRVVEVR